MVDRFIHRLAHGGSGRGECHTPYKKEGGIVREGEMCGGICLHYGAEVTDRHTDRWTAPLHKSPALRRELKKVAAAVYYIICMATCNT